MRIVDASLDQFRAKVVEKDVLVRVIRTTVPGYRVVGNQVLDELAVSIEYLADIPVEDGETEMWTAVESRPVSPRVRPGGQIKFGVEDAQGARRAPPTARFSPISVGASP
jgi:hypothetical protein